MLGGLRLYLLVLVIVVAVMVDSYCTKREFGKVIDETERN